MENSVNSIYLKKASLQTNKLSEKGQIQIAISELERKIIRYKSACLSCFNRPIDRENLINAQAELYALDSRLAFI